MSTQQVAVAETTELVPLTGDQYHRMLEAGILSEGEPIELLDGLVDRRLEVYEEPNPETESFAKVRLLTADDRIDLRISPEGDRSEYRPASGWPALDGYVPTREPVRSRPSGSGLGDEIKGFLLH